METATFKLQLNHTKVATKIGTNVIGRALGRLVPYVGWGVTAYDVITLPWGNMVNVMEENQRKLDALYGPGKVSILPRGPK